MFVAYASPRCQPIHFASVQDRRLIAAVDYPTQRFKKNGRTFQRCAPKMEPMCHQLALRKGVWKPLAEAQLTLRNGVAATATFGSAATRWLYRMCNGLHRPG